MKNSTTHKARNGIFRCGLCVCWGILIDLLFFNLYSKQSCMNLICNTIKASFAVLVFAKKYSPFLHYISAPHAAVRGQKTYHLARALRSHRRGQGFESLQVHHHRRKQNACGFFVAVQKAAMAPNTVFPVAAKRRMWYDKAGRRRRWTNNCSSFRR